MRILFVAYDNESYIHWFPQNLAYLSAMLKKEGCDVHIYNQDMYHFPDEHLTEFLNKNEFDIIGVGVIGGYYQYRKLLRISDAINRSKNRPFYVIGGHGPSPEPEYFLRKTQANVVVIGEGEITITELVKAVEGKIGLHEVKGIAFFNNEGKFIKTQSRELISDIDTIPTPAYELFPIDYYALLRAPHTLNNERCLSISAGRGCPFKCNFCYRLEVESINPLKQKYRLRSPEAIVGEIFFLKKDYHITYFDFIDDLVMVTPQRVEELCSAFIKAKLNIKWSCNGRLNFAKKDLLKLMKAAGCVFINYGIEAVDDTVLKNMNKNLTVKQIINGIENTLSVGISPGFNIIWGNIGDNLETLKKGVDFLLKYDDHAQFRTIRPVTPYPGSPLYYYAIDKGLLKDVEDFYENKHINSDLLTVNFTDLSDEEFHEALCEANKTLIKAYWQWKVENMINVCNKLYLQKDSSFRGFRQL